MKRFLFSLVSVLAVVVCTAGFAQTLPITNADFSAGSDGATPPSWTYVKIEGGSDYGIQRSTALPTTNSPVAAMIDWGDGGSCVGILYQQVAVTTPGMYTLRGLSQRYSGGCGSSDWTNALGLSLYAGDLTPTSRAHFQSGSYAYFPSVDWNPGATRSAPEVYLPAGSTATVMLMLGNVNGCTFGWLVSWDSIVVELTTAVENWELY